MFQGNSFLVEPTGEFNKIKLDSLDPVFIKFSSCCKPNPTDKSNCALLTDKWLSVHHKNCPRLHEIKFQREDAVDISWEHYTPIIKPQNIVFAHLSREELMPIIASAPPQMNMHGLTVSSDHPTELQAWELVFEVSELHELQKVLRHFDRLGVVYEFFLDF
jgi:GTP pyrophosphokinase